MYLFCSDLEGVFVPEIWINVAEKTGIEELRLTTRDISDYDVLMKKRLGILAANNLKLADIQAVIATIDPLEGAVGFLEWMKSQAPTIILSDTFTQFAGPLMAKLGHPPLFCNSLDIAPDGSVANYRMRQQDGKRKSVEAFKSLNYRVVAMGDSYNDITMLQTAEQGILFSPPDNVKEEFPEFPAAYNYAQLKPIVAKILNPTD